MSTFTSMPIALCKVIFGKNFPTAKIPRKNLGFKRDLHFQNFVIAINWHLSLD
jgi:hypothetical protein